MSARTRPATNGVASPPPHDADVERSVLGMCFRSLEYAKAIHPYLTPEDFYIRSHTFVWKHIAKVIDAGGDPDLVGVHVSMSRDRNYQSEFAEFMAWGSGAAQGAFATERDVAVLLELSTRRRMLTAAYSLMRGAHDLTEDAYEVMEATERNLLRAFPGGRGPFTEVRTATPRVWERMLKAGEDSEDGRTTPGLPTPFAVLDELTGGWKGGRHYVWLAATSVGKTAFGLACVRKVSLPSGRYTGHPSLIISTEMSADEITERLVSPLAGVPAGNMQTGILTADEWRRLEAARAVLDESRIYIEDTPRIHIEQLESKVRRAVGQLGVGFVVVDYLQKVKFDGLARDYERGIALVSTRVKELARELDVPIIDLSQVTRECAKAGANGVRPSKNDGRGSGEIENDADVVGYIYRAEACGLDWDEKRSCSTYRLAEIGLDKNRHGPRGHLLATFDDTTVDFVDVNPSRPADPGPTVEQAEMFVDGQPF